MAFGNRYMHLKVLNECYYLNNMTYDLVCREVAARFIVLQCIHANSITNHTSDVNHIFPFHLYFIHVVL